MEDHVVPRHYYGTYSQYSYPIVSRPEAASDVVAGAAIDEVDLDVGGNSMILS